MHLHDAVVYIQLAAYLTDDDAKLRRVAKRLVKRVHPNFRQVVGLICESKRPRELVERMSRELQAPSAWRYEGSVRPPLKPRQEAAALASCFSAWREQGMGTTRSP